MSHLTSSLAFAEVKEQILEPELELLVKSRHLSISSATSEVQPVGQVVKVSGSITVSF